MNKKVLIIGGGLAGLSAGIYTARAGFDVTVCEKTSAVGGLCSGWRRGDYFIDNCIHWMGGTLDNHSFNTAWREVGVIREGEELIKRKAFYASELDGRTLTLWRDTERTRSELLALSPEDAREINIFIDSVNLVGDIMGKESGREILSAFNSQTAHRSRLKYIAERIPRMKLNLGEYADRFKHPLIKRLILDFTSPLYEAYWLFLSYGMFASGDAELPVGGSTEIVRRMAEKYSSYGGTLLTGSPALSLGFGSSGKACEALLADGTHLGFDYCVLACDLFYAYNTLLNGKHTPPFVKKAFAYGAKTPVTSSFHTAFAVDGTLGEIDDTLIIPCEPFKCGARTSETLWIKNYRIYGDFIAPKGKTVIQTSTAQYAPDFDFWNGLYADKNAYNAEKLRAASQIEEIISARFGLGGRLSLLDCWTPASYYNRLGSYGGAYMRFLTGAFRRAAFIPQTVNGIDNVFLAGAWLTYPGGTPTAVLSGKSAAELIIKRNK